MIICDAQGTDYHCRLVKADREEVEAEVIEVVPCPAEPTVKVTVLCGLPKGDKTDYIIQKSVEAGAEEILFFNANRCVARPEGKDRAKRQERLARIALEAMKQCGRARVPEVAAPMDWKQALADMGQRELMLMPWEEAEGMTLSALHERFPEARDIGLLIGPEGGISGEEAEQVKAVAGGHALTLGGRILRTETAAVAALSVTMCLWGDL